MTAVSIGAGPAMSDGHHVALHLAHRWFAFFEAPGGDLGAHLAMFHPQVQLSGNRGSHLFARDHASLKAWLASVPDALSSHHIVHSSYTTAEGGDGLLSMVVAYQAPGDAGMSGSIISYQTRIAFGPDAARFMALDKTPILPDTQRVYQTSWSTNRVLARVHAELAGVAASDGQLRAALGRGVKQISAHVTAPEGSRVYEAIVTGSAGEAGGTRVVRLHITDDGVAALPDIKRVELLTAM